MGTLVTARRRSSAQCEASNIRPAQPAMVHSPIRCNNDVHFGARTSSMRRCPVDSLGVGGHTATAATNELLVSKLTTHHH
jgi:hypothetical protein